ncbi:MAG TPA: MBL fold metallo-hydrolase [Longimicrobium sp.]|nr:MBL fold metallo-hydrolase [Longimicrobium sp.]
MPLPFRHSAAALALVLAFSAAPSAPAAAQQVPDTVRVRVIPVAGGVSMLVGRGGNIALSAGDDGAFIVDDQYAPMSDRIRAAVASVTPRPVRFVLNTHWHGDHTGGNESFGKAGAVIVAHDNVRRRLSTDQFVASINDTIRASPRAALPVVTFADAVTLHLNGDEVHAFHVPPAHTDGDAIVHFRRANVVHMGDTFLNGNYPYVDLGSGGDYEGLIAAVDRVLAMVNDSTRIIPGHGALSNRAELREWRGMLVTVRDRIAARIAAGETLEQVKAARPTADLDPRWGGGFVNGERLVETVYRSLAHGRR